MSKEAIPLAQKLNYDKLEFPVFFSEKLDGVPIRMIVSIDAMGIPHVVCRTRQWEYAVSCTDDALRFVQMNMHMMKPGFTYNFVAEVTHKTLKGFKDVSGVVRRQSSQPDLVFNLFDFDAAQNSEGISGKEFYKRIMVLNHWHYPENFEVIDQIKYDDVDTLRDAVENTGMADDQEGWVLRSGNAPFKPGTRHWDYQKIVKEPTIDLWIVDVEEGKGKFAGGVGRMIAMYKGERIGVGPGKQTAAERKALLKTFRYSKAYNGEPRRMACIKYKPDEGYDALRQPTFQCWRDDKTEPDA